MRPDSKGNGDVYEKKYYCTLRSIVVYGSVHLTHNDENSTRSSRLQPALWERKLKLATPAMDM